MIGFAETATALGHAVYDCIENAAYVHTTREQIRNNEPSITFVEEHSHATDQLCYAEPHMINNNCPVILVDDEITTGKTALHIIRDIQSKFPRKEYAVLSLLDWRTEEHKQAYAEAERELGVTISTTALLSGRISFKGELLSESTYDYKPKPQESAINRTDIDLSGFFASLPYQPATFADEHFYVKETGRFGLKASDRQAVHEACRLNAACGTISEGEKNACARNGRADVHPYEHHDASSRLYFLSLYYPQSDSPCCQRGLCCAERIFIYESRR